MTEDTQSTQISNFKPMAIRFDWRDWEHFFDNSDYPKELKQEFIETLWSIVLNFVDLGYGLNPTQEICGEVIDLKAVLEVAVLNSDDPSNQMEGDAA